MNTTVKVNSVKINLPERMKNLNQWLLWRLENNRKVPLNTSYRKTDPTKGFSFSDVITAYDSARCNGLGFTVGNGIVCVDVDHCIIDNKLSNVAQQLVNELQTYTEVSQSGTGLHLFYIDTEAPAVGRKSNQLEIYSHKHYIAMTGNNIGSSDLAVLPGKTAELLEKYFPKRSEAERSETEQTEPEYELPDAEILDRASLLYPVKFDNLFYNGDTTGYSSNSEADGALLTILATLTSCNVPQMTRLFFQSKLAQRDKCQDRPDYIEQQQIPGVINFVQNEMKYPKYSDVVILNEFQHTLQLTSRVIAAALRCKRIPQTKPFYEDFYNFCAINIKKLKLSITQLKQRIKAVEVTMPSQNIYGNLILPKPYDAVSYNIPEGYIVSEDGIATTSAVISRTVFFVTQVSFTDNSLQNISRDISYCTLYTFNKETGWRIYKDVSNNILVDPKEFLAFFGQAIASVDCNNCRQLIAYIDKFRGANIDNIQYSMTTSKLGWNVDSNHQKFFVTPYECSKYIYKNHYNLFSNSLRIAGDYDTYVNLFSKAFTHSLFSRFILSACFAPVLLEPLHMRNFCIYLWGTSRIGKSTTLTIGNSVWGHQSAIIPFSGTLNSFSGDAIQRDGFPMIVDDKQSKRLEVNTNQLIMRIAGGKEDGRLNNSGESKHKADWKTILLTTGEEPIVEDSASNGIHTRMLSFNYDTLILPPDITSEFWQTINDNHYGHLGKAFVDYINSVDLEDVRLKHLDTVTQLGKMFSKYHEEHLNYVAFIMATESILCEHILHIPSQANEMGQEIIQMLDTKQTMSNTEKFWNHLISWIAGESAHFKSPKGNSLSPCYGEYTTTHLLVSKDALDAEFTRWSNLNVNKVINDLYAGGYLEPVSDTTQQTPRKIWRVTINNVPRVPCIKIPLKNISVLAPE